MLRCLGLLFLVPSLTLAGQGLARVGPRYTVGGDSPLQAPQAQVLYEISLVPGQSFTGAVYYWTENDTLSANLTETPSVPWLSLSGGQFTSRGCDDIKQVRYNFSAPSAPGLYSTTIADLNGNFVEIAVILTVTDEPPVDGELRDTLAPQESKVHPDPFLMPPLSFGCVSSFFPSTPAPFAYEFHPPVDWLSVQPVSGSIAIAQVIQAQATVTAPSDPGTYVTYVSLSIQGYAFPRWVRVELTVNDLRVVSPAAGDRWVAGQEQTIRWTVDKPRDIDIRVSYDAGTTYDILTIVPQGELEYAWTPPLDKRSSSSCRIKLTDAVDPQKVAESQLFTLRSLDLVKILGDNTLRPFDPVADAWTFNNSDGSALWPSGWYSQFTYRTGTDPYTGAGYPSSVSGGFALAAPATFPDWPLFVETYGQQACYSTGLLGGLNYRDRAVELWSFLRGTWGGSCYGLALGSLLAFSQRGGFDGFYTAMPPFAIPAAVAMDDSVRKVLNRLWVVQFGSAQTAHRRSAEGGDVRSLLAALRAMFLSEDASDDAILTLTSSSNSGRHAVVPYHLVPDQNTPTLFRLYVYDSNAPGSTTSLVELDEAANRWTDRLQSAFGSGTTGWFLSLPAVNALTYPGMPSPGDFQFAEAVTAGGGTSILFTSPGAELTVVDNGGGSLGFRDSATFSTITGASAIVPYTGGFAPPIGFVLPAGSYQATLERLPDSSAAVGLLEANRLYVARRRGATPDDHDLWNLGEGISVGNPDPAEKLWELKLIESADSSEFVVDFSSLTCGQGDSVMMRGEDPEHARLISYGGELSYDLSVRRHSASSRLQLAREGMTIPAGSSQELFIAGPGQVVVYTDRGNDGSVDDTLFIVEGPTAVQGKNLPAGEPGSLSLAQNYPNPFNPTTTINFVLPNDGFVSLKIYNLLGEQVATLIADDYQAGTFEVTWDASGMPSGIYFYRLTAGESTMTRRMVLMK